MTDKIGNLYMNKDGQFFRIVPVLSKSAQTDADGNDISDTYATKTELATAVGGSTSSIGSLEDALESLTETVGGKQGKVLIDGTEGEFQMVTGTSAGNPPGPGTPVYNNGDSVVTGDLTLTGTGKGVLTANKVVSTTVEGRVAPLLTVLGVAEKKLSSTTTNNGRWRKAFTVKTTNSVYMISDIALVSRYSPYGVGRMTLACYSEPDNTKNGMCRVGVYGGLGAGSFRVAKNPDGDWEVWCNKLNLDFEFCSVCNAKGVRFSASMVADRILMGADGSYQDPTDYQTLPTEGVDYKAVIRPTPLGLIWGE